jgi:hypothetical protein
MVPKFIRDMFYSFCNNYYITDIVSEFVCYVLWSNSYYFEYKTYAHVAMFMLLGEVNYKIGNIEILVISEDLIYLQGAVYCYEFITGYFIIFINVIPYYYYFYFIIFEAKNIIVKFFYYNVFYYYYYYIWRFYYRPFFIKELKINEEQIINCCSLNYYYYKDNDNNLTYINLNSYLKDNNYELSWYYMGYLDFPGKHSRYKHII